MLLLAACTTDGAAQAGGSVTPLYVGPMGGVESLGLDASAIYFPIEQAKGIVALPIDGGPARTIASTTLPTSGVALANGSVWWVEPGDDPSSPPVATMKVAKSGGAATVLAANQGAPHGIAVDATSVYWSAIDDGTIMQIAK